MMVPCISQAGEGQPPTRQIRRVSARTRRVASIWRVLLGVAIETERKLFGRHMGTLAPIEVRERIS